MLSLNCPECLTPMRGIERNGVTLKRCDDCGGMFSIVANWSN
jgi:Zn-finger nucleic acid-binding protein